MLFNNKLRNMFQNLDYRIIRYKDETYGLHEVYTEDGEVQGIYPEPFIEADSPKDIINKLKNLIKISKNNINNILDINTFNSFQSDNSDFIEL